MNYDDYVKECMSNGLSDTMLTKEQFDQCVQAELSYDEIFELSCDLSADMFNTFGDGFVYYVLNRRN